METAIMSSREPKQSRTSQITPVADLKVNAVDGWVSGVAFDGEAIWFVDNQRSDLVRIDADTGKGAAPHFHEGRQGRHDVRRQALVAGRADAPVRHRPEVGRRGPGN